MPKSVRTTDWRLDLKPLRELPIAVLASGLGGMLYLLLVALLRQQGRATAFQYTFLLAFSVAVVAAALFVVMRQQRMMLRVRAWLLASVVALLTGFTAQIPLSFVSFLAFYPGSWVVQPVVGYVLWPLAFAAELLLRRRPGALRLAVLLCIAASLAIGTLAFARIKLVVMPLELFQFRATLPIWPLSAAISALTMVLLVQRASRATAPGPLCEPAHRADGHAVEST